MMSKRFLIFLIPAFIGSLIYGYLQMPQQARVPMEDGKEIQRQQARKQPQGKKAATGYPRLRVDLLDRKPQPYPGVRRNLFSTSVGSSQNDEEIATLPFEPPEEIPPPVVIAVAPPPPPPPSAQEIARQELGRYKFVGFFKKGDKKTIFLATDGEVFLVRKGDYLGRDRKFYVVNVTDTTLELRKEDAGDFSIKLTDQESLSAVLLRALPAAVPATSGQTLQEQEGGLPEPPTFQPVPDGETLTEDQLQTEEDNNETQN